MKRNIVLSSVISIIMVWWLLYIIVDHHLILPSPVDVLLTLWRLCTSGETYLVVGLSLVRLIIAVLTASLLGIVLGIFAGIKKKVSYFLKPYVTLLRTIPIISIAVIILILVGFRLAPFIMTFLMVFPIVYQATESGMKGIDQSYIDIYHLEHHDSLLALKMLYLPLIKPYIILSLLQSFGLGLKVLVMSEYISQTKNSMGNSLYLAKTFLNYDEVVAWTFLLILISGLFELVIFTYQKRTENG